ncbi:MAG: leucine--tRNA ligase, partial [Spartobacteria bacterium]
RLGFAGLASQQPWPTHDEAHLVENEIELVVQVNGKVRERLLVPKDSSKEQIEKAAIESPKVAESITGLTIAKVIVVPGKLVNIVAK